MIVGGIQVRLLLLLLLLLHILPAAAAAFLMLAVLVEVGRMSFPNSRPNRCSLLCFQAEAMHCRLRKLRRILGVLAPSLPRNELCSGRQGKHNGSICKCQALFAIASSRRCKALGNSPGAVVQEPCCRSLCLPLRRLSRPCALSDTGPLSQRFFHVFIRKCSCTQTCPSRQEIWSI